MRVSVLFLSFSVGLILPIVSPQSIPEEDRIVDAGVLGKIKGVEGVTKNTKRLFIKFSGIKYGTNTRFGHSKLYEESLAPVGEIFNADNFGPPCPQTGGGNESCLFMNIQTHNVKDISEANLRPVLVFIHGAAFVSGNANAYSGELLLKRDIVVVSFNYRLGVYGFFCFNTRDIPCNAALYDAITALQWVQKYIHFFGGDPTRVTLAGQSSGSASVSHILLSPLAEGLFQRAMALSGTALNEWALASDPLKASLRIAELVGCYFPVPNVNPNLIEVQMCMLSPITNQASIIRAQDIYQAEERAAGRIGFDAVNPAVQRPGSLGTTPAFLTENPLDIINSGRQINVPLLLGATKHDGAFGLVLVLVFYMIPNGNLQNDPNFLKYHLVPTILSSLGIRDDTGGLYETVARTYLGETRLSGNFTTMLPGLVDMASVFYFKAGAYKTAQLHSRINSTYFYSFDFAGTRTNHNPILPIADIAAHADDLIYVFPVIEFEFNEREERMSDILVDYWVNYVTTGEPGLYPDGTHGDLTNWPKLTEDKPEYLIIDDKIRVDADYPGTWSSTGLPEVPDSGSAMINPTLWTIVLTTIVLLPHARNR